MAVATGTYDRWQVRFATGHTYEGSTPSQVLRRISKRQWTDSERQRIKRALCWRVYGTHSVYVDPKQDDGQFLADLARSGAIEVRVKDGERWLTF